MLEFAVQVVWGCSDRSGTPRIPGRTDEANSDWSGKGTVPGTVWHLVQPGVKHMQYMHVHNACWRVVSVACT